MLLAFTNKHFWPCTHSFVILLRSGTSRTFLCICYDRVVPSGDQMELKYWCSSYKIVTLSFILEGSKYKVKTDLLNMFRLTDASSKAYAKSWTHFEKVVLITIASTKVYTKVILKFFNSLIWSSQSVFICL